MASILDFLSRTVSSFRDDEEEKKRKENERRVFNEREFEPSTDKSVVDRVRSSVGDAGSKVRDYLKRNVEEVQRYGESARREGVVIPPTDSLDFYDKNLPDKVENTVKRPLIAAGKMAGVEEKDNVLANAAGSFSRGLVETPEENKVIRQKILNNEPLTDEERTYAQDQQIQTVGGLTEGVVGKAGQQIAEEVSSQGVANALKSLIKGTDEVVDEAAPLIRRSQLSGKQLSTPNEELIKQMEPPKTNISIENLDDDLPLIKNNTTTSPEIPPGQQERSFIQTVRESDKTAPEVSSQVEGTYKPITNKETLSEAQTYIDTNGADKAVAFVKDDTPPSALKTTVAEDLMRRLQNEGNYNQAVEIAESIAEKLTQAGQMIQAASIWGRLSPEGILTYAQRQIGKANADLPDGKKIKLGEDTAKKLVQLTEELKGLEEGSREYVKKVGEMNKLISDEIPVSIGQKLSTLQTMSHLINPKTFIRNVGGNTLFGAAENVSDVVATGLDKIISIATGKRTKSLPDLGVQAQGFKRGFKEGVEDAKLGIDTSAGDTTKYDIASQKTFKDNSTNPVERALSKLETVMNIELKATDRAAYQAAFDNTLQSQMKLNNVTEPTEEMIEIAHQDGLYKTLQDDSKVAQVLSSLKRSFNKVGTKDGSFGLGDLVLKYPKTPGNLLSRGIEYSPAGYIKSVYELTSGLRGGEFNQKKFVESLGRATVGTGVIALGAQLADAGVITGKAPEDYEVGSAERGIGGGPFRINTSALNRYLSSGFQKQEEQPGDKIFSYDWAQPISLLFSMGADMQTGAKSSDILNRVLESLSAGEESLTGQSVVKNFTDFVTKAGRDGIIKATTQAGVDSATSIVPTLSKQVAELADRDNVVRDTYDPNPLKENLNKMQSRIPLIRNQLPARVDQYGEPMQQYQDGNNAINIFLNPGFTSKIKDDEVAAEIVRLYEDSGETQQAPKLIDKKVNVNGEDIVITAQQRRDMQRYVGRQTRDSYEKLLSNEKFQKMTDEQKAKEMASLLSDIHTAAKIELLGHKPKTVSKRARKIVKKNRVQGEELPLIARE